MTVKTLVNIKGRIDVRGIAGAVAGSFVDRVSVSVSGPGRVYVAKEATMGILAYTAEAELANLALLTGTQQQSPIIVLGCNSCPRSTTTGPCIAKCAGLAGSTCATSNAKALALTNCVALLTGAETEGADLVTVTVTRGPLKATVPFRVWFPSNVAVSVEDATLSAVAGWGEGTTCAQLYQQTAVTVSASFSASAGGDSFAVDVTDYVRASLKSSDTGVAAVDLSVAGEVSVVGKATGQMEVQLNAGGSRGVVARVSCLLKPLPPPQCGCVDCVCHVCIPVPCGDTD